MTLSFEPQYHRKIKGHVGFMWEALEHADEDAIRSESAQLVKAGAMVVQRASVNSAPSTTGSKLGEAAMLAYVTVAALGIAFLTGMGIVDSFFPGTWAESWHPVTLVALACLIGGGAWLAVIAIFMNLGSLTGSNDTLR